MIMTEILSLETVKLFVESTDEFPVNFDHAWKWIGYSSKQKAKDNLVRNFVRCVDFQINQMVVMAQNRTLGSGRTTEEIKLTVDCFKSFCMMAGTPKGREVRQHFLRCEKQLKQLMQQLSPTLPEQNVFSLLAEMTEVVEAHIKASQSLNRAIHTTIHQQTDTLRDAFEKAKAVHQKLLSPDTAPYVEQVPDKLDNLVQLTPRLTSKEKRQAVNMFLDLLENLPPDDERRGWSSRQIEKYLGCSYRTILNIKAEREGRRRPPKYS